MTNGSILPKVDVHESRLIVDPENYISITSPFNAFIEEIHIRQGQKIRKGDLLFIPGMKGWLSNAKPEPSLLVPAEAAISIDDVRYIFIICSSDSLRRL